MNGSADPGAVKKFLIVSTFAPPAISGAPLMAYNLLRYFPENSFAILTSHASLDDKMVEDGHRLPVKYFFFDTPSLSTSPQKQTGLFLKCKRLIKRSAILRSLFHFLSIIYLPFNAVRRGRKIIKEEKIELLLGYSDHGPALLSTYLLHKLTGKPFCLHFYDLYYGNNFSWPFKVVARILEPRLFGCAARVSVMSEALAEYYHSRYGRDIAILHNSIPLDSSKPQETIPAHPKPYKIIYTGTVVWAQLGAIRNLVTAVRAISSPKIVVWLYTPHEKQYLESQGIYESEHVIFSRAMPHEMAAIQSSADLLFVGLSFNTRYPLLINTSSPGKTCEYLISGRPILVHAPKESYIAEYSRSHGFAHVVDENRIEFLKDGILKLISDPTYVSTLVEHAWNTARAEHDARKTSDAFRRFLNVSLQFRSDAIPVAIKT